MQTPFTHNTALGEISLVALDRQAHISLVHQWVTQEYAAFWGMQGYTQVQVDDFYAELERGTHTKSYMGLVAGTPQFLVEVYDPKQDQVGEHYEVREGDIGMHILIAPTQSPVSGFTQSVFTSVMHFLFSTPEVARVVVEPDHRNHKIHALNKKAGFQHIKRIKMGDKLANLAFCTRAQFHHALKVENNTMDISHAPELAAASIDAPTWTKVNRLHIRKCLAELSHERILTPQQIASEGQWGLYRVDADIQGISYEFRARVLELEHWLIDTASIRKIAQEQDAQLDSVNFIIEFAKTLEIPEQLLPTYMEEITSTLCSAAFKENKSWLSAEQLLDADFQQVEAAMSEGHPAFIANNGRIGFDAQDFLNYAPEAGTPIKLIWLAAHKDRADFNSGKGMSYESLFEQELDLTTREAFDEKIRAKGANPEDYLLIPVHPWQWFNKLANVFAPDLAALNLICLGYGDDAYQAQQSIRTFFNLNNPHKHYVKTALSVLNMGFMRGLSAYYMRTTPAINDWLYELVEGDKLLKEKGFCVLREIAATGYRNPYYEHETVKDSPYKKMLAALWRESPVELLAPGQRLMTMASLLHVDPDNAALLPSLINASGLTPESWLAKYFDTYMTPLLHCYYKHSLVFMPHGENLILVFENQVPVKAIMKDIGEEICLLNSDIALPEGVERIAIKVPEEEETLSIHTDVFDCFFRYMSAIMVEHMDFPETEFWRLVAQCIHNYQDAHPEFAAKYEKHNLFAGEFAHSCLNRLQLANNQQMVNLADPASSLKFAGTLNNPIAVFATQDTVAETA